ncbi:hypothetical protein [Terrabacter terrigena]|uniref:Uncharacterized protein n=1 Tax=Terrabacter terrigena TaxID=574718 RepID=A0ABW3N1I5_9MICO
MTGDVTRDHLDPLDETWEAWTTRVAADLAALADDEWVTFTVHLRSRASSTYAAEQAPSRQRRWRRTRGPGGEPAPVPDVFVQARRVGEVLAMECIADTEFEGLTDLTGEQLRALVGLGWEPDGEPDLSRTFAVGDPAAAGLLRASLEGVLGAGSPAEVDVRRATRR